MQKKCIFSYFCALFAIFCVSLHGFSTFMQRTQQEIELLRLRARLTKRFHKACADYGLIADGDHILVGLSGGKDSFLLAKLIQELKRHGQIPFEAHYVVMDPGYNEKNREYIENNAKLMNIPIEVFKTDIFEVANSLNPENPCYMCARMRRGHLYKP